MVTSDTWDQEWICLFPLDRTGVPPDGCTREHNADESLHSYYVPRQEYRCSRNTAESSSRTPPSLFPEMPMLLSVATGAGQRDRIGQAASPENWAHAHHEPHPIWVSYWPVGSVCLSSYHYLYMPPKSRFLFCGVKCKRLGQCKRYMIEATMCCSEVPHRGCQIWDTPEGVTRGSHALILEGPPLSNSKSTTPSS